MRIPLPCNFGDSAKCNGKLLLLKGVSWFQWTKGMEYTYFFSQNDFWHDTDFYTTFDVRQMPCEFCIPDGLLIDRPVKEHGYPLKGRGHAFGIHYENGQTYMDFIMTSFFFTHIRVQCDGDGKYVKGGNILFPPSWDTEEKRKAADVAGLRKSVIMKMKKASSELMRLSDEFFERNKEYVWLLDAVRRHQSEKMEPDAAVDVALDEMLNM